MSHDGFPPFISAQLQYLLNHYPHTIQVKIASQIPNPRLSRHGQAPGDVIYNAEFPLAAPDVIFGAEDEDFHPFHVLCGEDGDSRLVKNSLTDWNNKDPTRLLALVIELRDKYRSYQEKRVGEVDDDRLKFEISTMVSREGIEMHMSSGVEKPEEVKFAVPLMNMNINKMVPACPWRHPQKIYLQVIYPIGRKYASSPSAPRLKLMCTPELKALFSIDDVKLPSWLDGMCMAEYLPHLEELLQRQVLEAVTLIDVRRQFIEALAPLLGRPLEADPVFCRKASFLVCSGPFTFMLHVFLSTNFPKQQPSLMFQSTQHFNSLGMPVKSPLITEYPWSPRWETSQMADRISDFLVDESLNFKRHCNESHLQH
ncbi:PREDICTED: BRCA1-A complex subunit BRE-like isoform X2 [Populus euphratica]|uniref:BRISC and BRCA1-A complex member 2 n=1 Tax=Populus euphratica TaxID=75702 RepID=A0AAJ6VDH3_POPEU|nr:PREDICTED: BRCA1-A complex subunit BRE-like isoform X2 [Populus euphratica]